MRIIKGVAATVAALTLVAPAGAWTRFPAFEDVASRVAGRPVEVRCMYTGEWPYADAARTWFRGSTPLHIELSPRTCLDVLLLVQDPAGRVAAQLYGGTIHEREAAALLTLIHEAVHMTGERNEGVTECRALTLFPLFVGGLAPARALMLTDHARRVHAQKPPEYRTVC